MNRDSGLTRAAARAFPTVALVLTLGASGAARAQDATAADGATAADAAAAATAADQPRRGRDRRRSDESSADAPAPAAAAAVSGPATDAAPAAFAEPAGETVEARIVCKNIKLTGTKISRRICGTPDQWAAQEKRTTDNAQETMRQVRDRSSVVVSQPDNPLSPGGN